MTSRFEAQLTVQISGLESESAANEVNEAMSALLMAVYELPGFPGDVVVGAAIARYDPVTGEDDGD